ncbi:hypothetical protein LPJ67_005096, partial [Coemansia sp. RSA 1938]
KSSRIACSCRKGQEPDAQGRGSGEGKEAYWPGQEARDVQPSYCQQRYHHQWQASPEPRP